VVLLPLPPACTTPVLPPVRYHHLLTVVLPPVLYTPRTEFPLRYLRHRFLLYAHTVTGYTRYSCHRIPTFTVFRDLPPLILLVLLPPPRSASFAFFPLLFSGYVLVLPYAHKQIARRSLYPALSRVAHRFVRSRCIISAIFLLLYAQTSSRF